MNAEPVMVGGREIPAEAIAAEAQHHPAPDAAAAWNAAAEALATKIKAGGKGVWGQIPMPPNNVTPEEAKKLATWVLSQK